MTWKQQFDIITKIAQKKFIDRGRLFTFKDLENDLGLGRGVTTNWKKGQRASAKDMEKLSMGLGISPEWLLLGVGEPLPEAEPGKFNPEWVNICDTLRDFVEGTLRVDSGKFAQIGGLTPEELDACLSSRMLPPATAIGRWVRRYRLNANFLLAQIGEPQLTEEEYWRTGPLTRIFEKLRQDEDLDELEEQEEAAAAKRIKQTNRAARKPKPTNAQGQPMSDPLVERMLATVALLKEHGASPETIQQAILRILGPAPSQTEYPTVEEPGPAGFDNAAEPTASSSGRRKRSTTGS